MPVLPPIENNVPIEPTKKVFNSTSGLLAYDPEQLSSVKVSIYTSAIHRIFSAKINQMALRENLPYIDTRIYVTSDRKQIHTTHTLDSLITAVITKTANNIIALPPFVTHGRPGHKLILSIRHWGDNRVPENPAFRNIFVTDITITRLN